MSDLENIPPIPDCSDCAGCESEVSDAQADALTTSRRDAAALLAK